VGNPPSDDEGGDERGESGDPVDGPLPIDDSLTANHFEEENRGNGEGEREGRVGEGIEVGCAGEISV